MAALAEPGPYDMCPALYQFAKTTVMVVTDVLTEILRLPAEQRAKLALALIRSLDSERDIDATEAWDDEIERRAAEVEASSAETMTLDEYRKYMRARRAARTPR